MASELDALEKFGGEIKLLLPHIECLSHPHLVGKVRNDAWCVWGDKNISWGSNPNIFSHRAAQRITSTRE